jgi:hypothetical protein
MAEKNKGGRPPFELSDKDFEKLVAMIRIQCTQEEICNIYGVTHKTLNKALKERGEEGFSQLYKKHQDEGCASLRRSQWKAATEKLNPTMLVWLGKQMLGQRDQVDMHHGGEVTVNKIERVIVKAADPDT